MTARIAILICTHDRPQFLRALLEGLVREVQPGTFLAVVDNGTRSSKAVVDTFRDKLEVYYQRIDEPGLVIARNACVELALAHAPEFLVFIDDDETPNPGWLSALLDTMRVTGADIVTGPVEAKFLAPPPRWALEGNYFQHDGSSYRTSNLAIRAKAFPRDRRDWFQAEFNRLGGEDSELLSRLVDGGAVHKVSPHAIVTEFVPEERMRRRYIWRCGIRDGAIITQTVFSKQGVNPRSYGACLLEIGRKLGYAANHTFWAISAPWRINNAVRDLYASAGILLAMAGLRSTYYGNAFRSPGQPDG